MSVSTNFSSSSMPASAARAALTLEVKRPCNHAHSKNVAFTRHPGDYGRRSGSGATAHPSCDKQHVQAVEVLPNLLPALFGGATSDIRFRACTKSFREAWAELYAPAGTAVRELLRVRVCDNELDSLQIHRDHVIHGVGTTSADAEHCYPGSEVAMRGLHHGEIQGHIVSSVGTSIRQYIRRASRDLKVAITLNRRTPGCLALAVDQPRRRSPSCRRWWRSARE